MATGPHAVVDDHGTGTTLENNLEIDDPMFADPDNGDPLSRSFALEDGSAAIDQGITVPVLDDYLGTSRVGLTYDVGAHEYIAPE